MLAYSAMKIRANPLAPYSILKPDTSSDSPSAKSKGVRFVSATQEISHRAKVGAIRKMGQCCLAPLAAPLKVREWVSTKMPNKIIASLIS